MDTSPFTDGALWWLREARSFAASRGPLFLFNTTLALIPLVLGYLTFRPRRRPTPLWWCGAALFLLFLPNAAYVLTDAVHLRVDLANTESRFLMWSLYLPGYLAFFLVGFTCYVLALRRLEATVRVTWPEVPWWPVWVGVQGLVAVGVYLGREIRLHSWHVVTRTDEVVDGLATLTSVSAVRWVAITTAAFCLGTLAWRPVVEFGARLGVQAGQRIARHLLTLS
jgi:uncharacterized membrane protein